MSQMHTTLDSFQTTDKLCSENDNSLNGTNSMPHFSFDTAGAKEKFAKENAERRISRSAEREEVSATSTAQAFEKA